MKDIINGRLGGDMNREGSENDDGIHQQAREESRLRNKKGY